MIRPENKSFSQDQFRGRLRFVLGALTLIAGRSGRARGRSAGSRRWVPRRSGRRTLYAHRETLGESRRHLRSQRRVAGGEHAGRHRLGMPAGSHARGRSDSAARRSAQSRQEVADAGDHEQSRSRVRVSRAAHASERCGAGRGAQDSRRVSAARVSALLSGRRSDRSSARLHQEVRRHRPGRTRARL